MSTRRRTPAAFNRLEKGPILVPPALEFEFRMRVLIGAPLDQGTWDGEFFMPNLDPAELRASERF